MPGKTQQTFIKITDWFLTGITIALTGYISFRFIMLMVGPIFGITESTTKLYYPVQFQVEEEGIAAIGGQNLPVKLKKAEAFALIESPAPTGLLIPVKLMRFGMFGVVIWVLFLLRQIVRTVGEGHPFIPDNGKRLRWIGLSILAVTFFDFIHDILLNLFITPRLTFESIVTESTLSLSIEDLLSAMVIIVIGEAFRIGAEMKKEQDLMI
ncbi:DUF2975 domain-containing protein [Candidatus Marinimicrobia bacterium]|nr:DUF2975 domain-containing protein [Candidatus Neomarinimicrobiota bacterium]